MAQTAQAASAPKKIKVPERRMIRVSNKYEGDTTAFWRSPLRRMTAAKPLPMRLVRQASDYSSAEGGEVKFGESLIEMGLCPAARSNAFKRRRSLATACFHRPMASIAP